MDRIQRWFDQIVGIAQDEEARRAFAREVFGTPQINVAALELPACWRRPARVVRARGR